MTFTIENSGTKTYLIHEIDDKEKIDSVCMGMITNNNIEGIIPFIFTQMDSAEYLKYNITSKITLARFLSSTVTRKQLLNVISSIANAIMNIEDYMIKMNMLLLDMEHIYINIGSYHAEIIPLPFEVMNEFSLSDFFKRIMSSAQFDTSENSDYVGRIISFLNSIGTFSIDEFLKLINELKNVNNVQAPQNKLKTDYPKAIPEPQMQPKGPIHNPPPMGNTFPQKKDLAAGQPQQPAPPKLEMNQPDIDRTQKTKRKGIFSRKKDAKPSEGAQSTQFAVPGVPTSFPQPIPASTKPTTIEPSKTNQKNTNSQMSKKAVSDGLSSQNNPSPMPQQHVNPPIVQGASFGETTVLSSDEIGETTVLSGNSNSQLQNPHLIRERTKQVIFINKPVLRIGAEKSYADFYLGDNPAISRSHADILKREEKFYIIDNNSTNQTYVDDKVIPPGTEIEIIHGTIIKLADERFEFNLF